MDRSELAKQYVGTAAKDYDERRRTSGKWLDEETAVSSLIAHVPHGISLVDIPVGTGRFLEIYKSRGLAVTGIDISHDMLRIAAHKAEEQDFKIDLKTASILDLPYANGHFDFSLCMRLLNWFEADDMGRAIGERARVSNRYVLFGVRTVAEDRRVLDALRDRFGRARRLLRSGKAADVRITVHSAAAVREASRKAGLVALRSVVVPFGPRGTTYTITLAQKA